VKERVAAYRLRQAGCFVAAGARTGNCVGTPCHAPGGPRWSEKRLNHARSKIFGKTADLALAERILTQGIAIRKTSFESPN